MMHDDRFDGLGDEELMTVQGLDDGYADYDGLYQAPDGSLYGADGYAEELDDAPDAMPGEVRLGADGRLYQWVQGYDGLGDPVGFWSLIPGIAKTVLPLVASRVAPRLRRLLAPAPVMRPVRRRAAPPPVVQPPPEVQQTPEQPVPVPDDAGDDLTGFGALYQAPDGSLYQMQGVGEDESLSDEEYLRGLDDDELFGADEELSDTDGYVRDTSGGSCSCSGLRGIDAYVPSEPPQTRPFIPPAVAPDMWRPLW